MLNPRWCCVISVLFLWAGRADVRQCVCDFARPETLTARECSLCKAAEAQPSEPAFFLLKDANPNKPNRWLALPRVHGDNPQDLSDFTPGQRAAYWSFAIAKGRELFGEDWGLAINSLERRTQCHAHIHIGKMRPGVEEAIPSFSIVDDAASIPIEREGDGLLVHAAGARLHVHRGNDSPELQLER